LGTAYVALSYKILTKFYDLETFEIDGKYQSYTLKI